MLGQTDEDVAKKEEERLLRSMSHKNTANLMEQKKKEAEKKRAAEEKRKAAEKQTQAATEANKHKEEERQAKVQASVEAARKEREAEEARRAAESSAWSMAEGNAAEEAARREEERVRKTMGAVLLQDETPAQHARRQKAIEEAKHLAEIEARNAAAEHARLEVQREEDRMARSFGPGPVDNPHITPFSGGVGSHSGEMGNIATGTVQTLLGGSLPAVPPGPPTTMSSFEMEVWGEMNKVRMNPKGYVKYLQALEPYYAGYEFNIPNTTLKRHTKEGKRALQEAISFLENHAVPGPVLKIDAHFSKSAADLCADQGPLGGLSTKLSDGTEPSIRLLRYGKWQKKCAECVSFGAYNARDVVNQWLIDDGNPQRPNRLALFDRELCVVGIASAYHAKYERMLVACFAFDFVEGHDKPVEPLQKTIDKFKYREEDIADLEEAPDGRSYIIKAGNLRVPKSQLALSKKGQLLELQRTITDADGKNPRVSSFKWEVPYRFNPRDVRATINSAQEVTILLTKPDLLDGDQPPPAGVEVEVLTLTVSPSGAAAKPDLRVTDLVDHIDAHIIPSKYSESVSVRMNGMSVIFIAKHKEVGQDEQGEFERVVTTKRNLTLEFAVSKRHFFVSSSGPEGVIIRIDKPTFASDDGSPVAIPIHDS